MIIRSYPLTRDSLFKEFPFSGGASYQWCFFKKLVGSVCAMEGIGLNVSSVHVDVFLQQVSENCYRSFSLELLHC